MTTRLQFVVMAAVALLVFAKSAQATNWKELPQLTVVITKEDVQTTDIGKKVAEYNKRLRKIAAKADSLKKEKDSEDSIAILKEGFDKLKKERDTVGKPIRGLVGLNLVLIGDLAIKNMNTLKQLAMHNYISYNYYGGGLLTNNTVYGYYTWSGYSASNKGRPHVNLIPPSNFEIRYGRIYKEEGPGLQIEEGKSP